MKKSSFVALLMGTVSGMLFALGMCMVLLPEWNALRPGMILGLIGMNLGGMTFFAWRKMEGKAPLSFSRRTLFALAVGTLGVLLLGVGLCFCLIWSKMAAGILAGMAGILLLLCLIPIIKGFRD